MPIIKAISDLTSRANKLSDLIRNSPEPIFITRNGEGDMVLFSIALYRQHMIRLDLYAKLTIALSQMAAGDRGRAAGEVVRELRKVMSASAE